MLSRNPQENCIKAVAIPIPEGVTVPPTPGVIVYLPGIVPNISKKNEGATIMSIEERSANANKRIEIAEQQRRLKERSEREDQGRKARRRHYIIGELVATYFPTVQEYEPGTHDENRIRFEPLEAFLYVLSTDPDLVDELRDRAARLVSEDPDGEWRTPM